MRWLAGSLRVRPRPAILAVLFIHTKKNGGRQIEGTWSFLVVFCLFYSFCCSFFVVRSPVVQINVAPWMYLGHSLAPCLRYFGSLRRKVRQVLHSVQVLQAVVGDFRKVSIEATKFRQSGEFLQSCVSHLCVCKDQALQTVERGYNLQPCVRNHCA